MASRRLPRRSGRQFGIRTSPVLTMYRHLPFGAFGGSGPKTTNRFAPNYHDAHSQASHEGLD